MAIDTEFLMAWGLFVVICLILIVILLVVLKRSIQKSKEKMPELDRKIQERRWTEGKRKGFWGFPILDIIAVVGIGLFSMYETFVGGDPAALYGFIPWVFMLGICLMCSSHKQDDEDQIPAMMFGGRLMLWSILITLFIFVCVMLI